MWVFVHFLCVLFIQSSYLCHRILSVEWCTAMLSQFLLVEVCEDDSVIGCIVLERLEQSMIECDAEGNSKVTYQEWKS